MEEESRIIYLQNLDEYILDEERIVTVRWLSKTLNILHTDATELITTWIQDKKNEDTELFVTYVVTGVKKDGNLVVTVLRENAIDNVAKLTNLSKSVYSVQKGSTLKNIQLLAAVDPTYNPSLGAIKCPIACRKVTPVALSYPEKCAEVKLEKAQEQKIVDMNVIKDKEVDKLSTTQKSAKAKENIKGGITNFFAKASSKPQSTTSKKAPISEKASSQSMQRFFKKVSPPKTEPKTHDEPILKEEQPEEKIATEVLKISEDEIIENTPEAKKVKTKKRVNHKKTKRGSDDLEEETNHKRRKRIVTRSDSSDDDIFGKESDDEKHESTNAESVQAPVEQTVTKQEQKNVFNNKRKKVVNKTYTDDDGYFITSREIEECSASEDEAPNIVEQKPAVEQKQSIKNPSLNTNKKQSNLMNFFKKK